MNSGTLKWSSKVMVLRQAKEVLCVPMERDSVFVALCDRIRWDLSACDGMCSVCDV